MNNNRTENLKKREVNAVHRKQKMSRTIDHIAYGLQARATHWPLIDVHPAGLAMHVVKKKVAANVEYGVDAGS
jgi:hypothetical protein